MNSQTSPGTTEQRRHRHRRPGQIKRLALFTILPACASAAAVWGLCDLVGGTSPGSSQVVGQQAPAPASHNRPVELVGQVVAISPESITTRSSDGTTTTFAITPTTTQINTEPTFTVDDTVAVVGVVSNGTPVATALADESVTAGDGPPMDGV